MEASTGELHGTMIASQTTSDGCAYAYGSWNTLQLCTGHPEKNRSSYLDAMQAHCLSPIHETAHCKTDCDHYFCFACSLHRPACVRYVHLACRQASRMQQELMLLLLCSPSASICTKQMHSTLTSCIDNEPTMRHAEHSLLCILQT